MKMFLIVFRTSLEEDVMQVLKGKGVHSFTAFPSVLGIGEAGEAIGGLDSLGTNSMLLVAVEEEKAKELASSFRSFHGHLVRQQHGAKIPLRVFEFPCEQIV